MPGSVPMSANCKPSASDDWMLFSIDLAGHDQALGDDAVGGAAVLEIVQQTGHADGEAADHHGHADHPAFLSIP